MDFNEKNEKKNPETKWELFKDTFLKAVAVCLSFAIVYCTVIISYKEAQTKSDNNVGNSATQSNDKGTADIDSSDDKNIPAGENQENSNSEISGQKPQSEDTVKKTVELYNTSVNRIKKEATSVTRNYKKLESLPEYLKLPSAIQSIGSAAIEQFVKGTDEPETWTSKEDINAVFPVGGTDYSSHLTADMVEKAVCKDNGDTYQIGIKLYDDKITSPEKGQGYAGVFNTVSASTFENINIPTVTYQSVNVNGINGYIFCTIDKASGRVTKINFRNADILALDVKVAFSSFQAQFALSVEEDYTIKY
ncbi:MAG: hypothetical protein ACI4KI_07155 [Candidatus Fimenecus sp.]